MSSKPSLFIWEFTPLPLGVVAELRLAHHNHLGKNKPMNLFFHGYHGQQYCSWARTHDGDGEVAQYGGHTPNNRLTDMQRCMFTVYIFDIEHPCYEQLTPVKTRYLVTSIM